MGGRQGWEWGSCLFPGPWEKESSRLSDWGLHVVWLKGGRAPALTLVLLR